MFYCGAFIVYFLSIATSTCWANAKLAWSKIDQVKLARILERNKRDFLDFVAGFKQERERRERFWSLPDCGLVSFLSLPIAPIATVITSEILRSILSHVQIPVLRRDPNEKVVCNQSSFRWAHFVYRIFSHFVFFLSTLDYFPHLPDHGAPALTPKSPFQKGF